MTYGIYLQCETCKATIGGEQVTPKQQGIPTLTRHESAILRKLAGDRGWLCLPGDLDYCPDCPHDLITGAKS